MLKRILFFIIRDKFNVFRPLIKINIILAEKTVNLKHLRTKSSKDLFNIICDCPVRQINKKSFTFIKRIFTNFTAVLPFV